ncbi:hypothetical protein ElyMa_000519100 [Elysia marginata]|uniref:Uncharacterized protein n=1 Tax=Elysia marginata TaxID=1093978 RepID=A0AAV4FX67_9GAST|nr:hypothetical protein ElyMa_000519100 [Elysia marginata]
MFVLGHSEQTGLLFTARMAALIAVYGSLVAAEHNPQPLYFKKISVPTSRFNSNVGKSTEKPAFCNDLDCPEYKQVLKTKVRINGVAAQ